MSNSNARSARRIQALVRLLADPDDLTAQRAEALLIRYYAGRSTVPLIEACSHPDPCVRFRAVWILAKSKDTSAFKTILRLTEDPDRRVQYDAALGLGELGDKRAIEHLRVLAERSDLESCCLGAQSALLTFDSGPNAMAF